MFVFVALVLLCDCAPGRLSSAGVDRGQMVWKDTICEEVGYNGERVALRKLQRRTQLFCRDAPIFTRRNGVEVCATCVPSE